MSRSIYRVVQQGSAREESDEEGKEEEEKIIHSAAKDALETALKYLEQQPTAKDVMWPNKWRDIEQPSQGLRN